MSNKKNMKNFKKLLVLLTITIIGCNTNSQNSAVSTSEILKTENFDLNKNLLANGYVAVQITKAISGHLHLYATINDVAGRFVLDTGAGATVLETARAEKFKLNLKTTEELATGAGGAGMEMQENVANHIKIAALSIPDNTIYLMNLDHVNDAFTAMGMDKVDGVIGADILESQHAIIDYEDLTLYLKK